MNKRMKRNLMAIVTLTILAILTILALQTFVVGFKLASYTSNIVESQRYANDYSVAREYANKVYADANEARNELYNSRNAYTRFLANMTNNLVRVPFAIFMMLSPVIFFMSVRKYNLSRRKRARI